MWAPPPTSGTTVGARNRPDLGAAAAQRGTRAGVQKAGTWAPDVDLSLSLSVSGLQYGCAPCRIWSPVRFDALKQALAVIGTAGSCTARCR
jgi:hypothetical protein